MNKNLPIPECKYGYTEVQITSILGVKLEQFNCWMRGKTGAICDGREYNYDKKIYESTNCGPHGFIIYKTDLLRFLNR